MKTAKHFVRLDAGPTPGPWHYTATAGEHDFAVYPESTGRDVALIRDFHEPNARLIAAAPDLLEALRELVAEFDTDNEPTEPGYGPRPDTGGIVLARDAIRKATGETT
jgi:hypothetical protein